MERIKNDMEDFVIDGKLTIKELYELAKKEGFRKRNFNFKTEFNMKKKSSFYHSTLAFAYVLLVAVFLWVAISSTIQRFKCAKLTETEIFIRIPKSFVCDWANCN